MSNDHLEYNAETRTVTGWTNPVLCAAFVIRSVGLVLDEEEFKRVAEEVGEWDKAKNEGFIFQTPEEALLTLTEIGNFTIYIDSTGVFRCHA